MSNLIVMLVVNFLLMSEFFISAPERFEVSIVVSGVPSFVMVGWCGNRFVVMDRLMVHWSVMVVSLPVFVGFSKVW
jgi:hypothetical protein